MVEDHVLLRQGTGELLEREEDLEVVAEPGDGEEAVRLVSQHRPDVVLQEYLTAGRLGIVGMHERARLLGGSLLIQSAPGSGTTVTVDVPLQRPPKPAYEHLCAVIDVT